MPPSHKHRDENAGARVARYQKRLIEEGGRRVIVLLDDADAARLDHLVETYGTAAAAIRVAIRKLERGP